MAKKKRKILYITLGIILGLILIGSIYYFGIRQSTTCTTSQQCNDGNSCTTDICNNLVCSNIPISGCSTNCDDGNRCTTDIFTSGGCQHSTINNCCTSSLTCDDSDTCTKDMCVNYQCVHTVSTTSICNDNNKCTTDICSNSICNNIQIKNCCLESCSDNNACTTDICSGTPGVCSHIKINNCCLTSCNDNNACTSDICQQDGTCKNIPISGCGTACNDGNSCTTDLVDAASTDGCKHIQIVGCHSCSIASDCEDDNECTTNKCTDNKCDYAGIPNCVISVQCTDAITKNQCELLNGCTWHYDKVLGLEIVLWKGECTGVTSNPCTTDEQCASYGENQVCREGICILESNACSWYQKSYEKEVCGFNPFCWLGITKKTTEIGCKTAPWVYISGLAVFILIIVLIRNLGKRQIKRGNRK